MRRFKDDNPQRAGGSAGGRSATINRFRPISEVAGFTLVELLVVVGIIVALAAITIPMVTRFIGTGQMGAMVKETENVQGAMSIMMADQNITVVDAVINPGPAANNFNALPAGMDTVPLYGALGGAYLQKDPTAYYYCWTSNGDVYTRDADPQLARTAGSCRAPP